MTLAPGTRLGAYEITAFIGAGGMGEVYRARDTRLKRDVAVKILPQEFAQDTDRAARFQREAEVLASLSHSNIAHIYGVEHHNGTGALILELVDGPTLADRIAQGPIPIREALQIAGQIAEGLEAAHAHGVIHRDLKPANVKVRADGTVKILDFGLAKALAPAGDYAPGGNMSQSPTLTAAHALTGVSVLLGTAAYMAPEQAAGGAADRRSDLWAFGVVVMEMLTGRSIFTGETVSHVLASVLKSEPDWSSLPASTPAPLRRLLHRCLDKDRKRRLDSAAAARLDIEDALIGSPHDEIAAAVPARKRDRAVLLVAALSVVAALAAGAAMMRARVAPDSGRRPVMRVEVNLPDGVELFGGSTQTVAMSPDGTRMAFVGVLGGVRQVYVRRLDQMGATPLRGTENSNSCFFSPDGNALAVLTAGGLLKKVSLADELVVQLASDVDFFAGGAWGADRQITFGRKGALWQIADSGGAARQVTQLDPGAAGSHLWPAVVGDGTIILFSVATGRGRGSARIEALTVATGQRRIVVDPGMFPMYASGGPLIFFRDDALLAASFEADTLQLTGPPIRVVDDLAVEATGGPIAALAAAGVLAYASTGQAASHIVWVSRQGVEQPLGSVSRHYQNPRLAPDGRQLVVTANGDLWIQDTTRATVTRLTSNDTTGNSFPTWTPDGKRVVFRTQTGLRWIDTDGSGRSEPIAGTSVNDYPGSVSPDGKTLAITRITPNTSADVYTVSLHGAAEAQSIVTGPAYEGGPQFSPDGRWLAYVSDESGAAHVYLRPFPGPGRRWQLSTQGGRQPLWNRNGTEVFYRDNNKMMAVDVSTAGDVVLSPPRVLFEQRYAFGTGVTTPNYDIASDGQRFVMVKGQSGSGRLNLVINWFEELKQRVP